MSISVIMATVSFPVAVSAAATATAGTAVATLVPLPGKVATRGFPIPFVSASLSTLALASTLTLAPTTFTSSHPLT